MPFKKIVLLKIILITSFSHAEDVQYSDEFGRTIIHRSSHVKNAAGNNVVLSQRFLSIDLDKLMYIKGSSSPETLSYADEYCNQKGQLSDIEYAVKLFNIHDQILMSCSSDLKFKEKIAQRAGFKNSSRQAIAGAAYQDYSWFNVQGEKVIERNINVKTTSGKRYATQKRYLLIEPHRMMYINGSATAETLAYEDEMCAEFGDGAQSSINKGLQFMSLEAAYGFSCTQALPAIE